MEQQVARVGCGVAGRAVMHDVGEAFDTGVEGEVARAWPAAVDCRVKGEDEVDVIWRQSSQCDIGSSVSATLP